MPKRPENTLAWSAELAAYVLHSDAQARAIPDADAWTRWLDDHHAFSFQGRHGRLHLLKERRKAGPGYWYAYRRQGLSIAKRYAGRSAKLTVTRLEELAAALAAPAPPALVPQPAQRREPEPPDLEQAAAPLLAPKLQPPRLHPALVRRERLLAQLEAGRERKLTLLSAPAGFGKTTLVRQWLAEVASHDQAPAVAWLALDPADNDPLRFLRYVIAACRTFGPAVGAHSLALLDASPSRKLSLDAILTAFINELAHLAHERILVLEDYHAIAAPQIHAALALLLEHLPRHLHLLMIARAHPPLPLARLAVAGELMLIEAHELRFSDIETATFLRQNTALALTADAIALVDARLEGWAAGLRLLTLTLEGRADSGDVGRILEHFIAGRRAFGDYFVAEVLQSQPAPLQQFLLQTSFLGRLTASLCDHVTGRASSQELLESLEQADLFIEPLDEARRWFRYHALFATAMQDEARRRLGGAAVRALLERAGQWYEAHGLLAEAIDVALAAHDPQRAAGLIVRQVEPQFSLERPAIHGPPEFYTLQGWLSRLPPAVFDAHPLLNLALASALLFTAIVEMRPVSDAINAEIERLLARAERGFGDAGERGRLGQVFSFRALLLRERGAIAAALDWARAALDALPPAELNWRSICVATLGLGEQYAGRLAAAAALFDQARSMCEQLGNRPIARANAVMLVWILLEQNDLQRADTLLRQILAEARDVGDADDIAHCLYGLAEVALSWDDLDAAWAQASDVVDLTRAYPHELQYVSAVLCLARVEQARGQLEAASARCAALLAERQPALWPIEAELRAQIAFEQARIALAAGDEAAARQWRATRPGKLERPRLQLVREAVFLARLHMAEGDPGAATQLLEPLLAAAEAGGCGRVALELRALLGPAYAAAGRPQLARQMAVAALASAYPANALRVLRAEGEALTGLLRAALPALPDPHLRAFATTVQRGITAAEASPDLLSPQERRVLRLMSAGRNNAQIAAELVVSLNTVKVHIKSVYRKLQVRSRIEAANAARELGLR